MTTRQRVCLASMCIFFACMAVVIAISVLLFSGTVQIGQVLGGIYGLGVVGIGCGLVFALITEDKL